MTIKRYVPSSPFARGTSKIVSNAKDSSPSKSHYKIMLPKNSNKEFIIVKFEKGNPQDIYAELELYYEFGQKGISPRIHFVKLPGVEEPVTLSKFARLYRDKHVIPESYLVEKSNCGNVILNYYGSSFMFMFSKLREFLEEKIVGNGYVNTDIKIANLCIDGTGNFLLIDLDPNFIQPVQSSGHTDDYVNYMLFQVYCNLCMSRKMVFSIKDLNDIVKNYDLRQMIVRLYSFKVDERKGHTHPLSNLLWYSGITPGKLFYYRDASEFYNDIINALTSLPKITTAPIATAPIPTAYEPTMMLDDDQESPTAQSPTPKYYNFSNLSTTDVPSFHINPTSDSTPFISNSSLNPFSSRSFEGGGGRKKTKRRIPKKRSMKRRRMRK